MVINYQLHQNWWASRELFVCNLSSVFQIGILLCYKCPLHKQKIDHEDKENTVENHSIMESGDT